MERPHVIAFRKREKVKLLDELAADVPRRLHELMMSNANQNAAVRACVALNELAERANGEPTTRQISTGGIVIMLGTRPNALPSQTAPPMTIEHTPQRIERDDRDE
jgi:hypothetical protein